MNDNFDHDPTGKQSCEEMHLDHKWLQMALSSIGDAIIASDIQGRVTFTNPAAQLLTGWSEDEARGVPLHNVFRIVDEETREPVEISVDRALLQDSDVGPTKHVLLNRPDGIETLIAENVAPIRNAAGEVLGVVLSFREMTKQRLTEIAARDAKRYAENIVNTVRHPLLILDGDLRVQTANRSFYKAFGVALEQTENHLLYELGNGQWDIPELRKLLTEILSQNVEIENFEVEHDFHSLGHRSMLLNARRICRDGESTELILLAIEDVTEQRRTEQERREIETRFTSLVKNIKDHSIFTLDPLGHITSWNREAENILGFSEQEALGQHFSIIFTPEDLRQGVPQQELNVAREIGRAEDERWHRRKDGKLFWALGIVTRTVDCNGKHTGFSKILRDMTDRKRAEEKLLRLVTESERQQRVYETALSNTEDFNYVLDLEGRFIYANRALLVQCRKELTEVVGNTFSELGYPAELAAHLRQKIRQVIETKHSVKYEAPHKGDDDERHYEHIFVPVMDAHGQVEAVSGSTRDVTQRKRLEDNLQQLAADLSEADHRKTEFLAMLGHELRNPLAPLRTGLELMKLAPNDTAQMDQTRRTMEVQVQQLMRLVDDLLDVSRITQGKLNLRKSRVALAEVLQNAVEASRPFIDEAGHQLLVKLPAQPIYLDADPHRLTQIVSNLLNNSAKFTPEKGRICLAAEQNGNEAMITVKDNGIGIPVAMQHRVFEMFNQLDMPLEHERKGLGIGLTLVQQLIEMHGGKIEVNSEGENQGSEFTVRLPALRELPAGETMLPEQDGGAKTSGLRILVVDDNRAAATMLSMVVKMLGNEVRTASDGQEAVEMAPKFLPDVIMMDIGMPKMNGYEAAEHIRQQPWGEKMMLVALTGWGQEKDKQQAREAGFDHHLVKPAEPSEIKRLLATKTTR